MDWVFEICHYLGRRKTLQYLVAKKPLLWIETSSQWSEDIDWYHNWSAFSLSRLEYFFFQIDSHIFFDSNFKILTRVFFSFVNIYFANLDSCFLLHSMYFTSFDLSIMFSTCFYYRYNFVRNGTPYLWLLKNLKKVFVHWKLKLLNFLMDFVLTFGTYLNTFPLSYSSSYTVESDGSEHILLALARVTCVGKVSDWHLAFEIS